MSRCSRAQSGRILKCVFSASYYQLHFRKGKALRKCIHICEEGEWYIIHERYILVHSAAILTWTSPPPENQVRNIVYNISLRDLTEFTDQVSCVDRIVRSLSVPLSLVTPLTCHHRLVISPPCDA
uniref:Uncharacterized protein n=1 Tax=Timema douglasi TaxID=61478 RepID=A0A7R8Z4L2_TIMDO|nr:unnamed protein product [Timema douglasi]